LRVEVGAEGGGPGRERARAAALCTHFHPQRARRHRFGGGGPGTLSARVSGKSTYNLRAVKRPGEVLLFVDGRQVMRVPGEWPAARVGLSTQGMAARFDGLLRFHIPTAGDARSAP